MPMNNWHRGLLQLSHLAQPFPARIGLRLFVAGCWSTEHVRNTIAGFKYWLLARHTEGFHASTSSQLSTPVLYILRSFPSNSLRRNQDSALRGLAAARGPEHSPCRGGRCDEFFARANGPADQFPAAVGAAAAKHALRARLAEGTLERANAGVGRIRRQVAVAAFAIWPKFEHGNPAVCHSQSSSSPADCRR